MIDPTIFMPPPLPPSMLPYQGVESKFDADAPYKESSSSLPLPATAGSNLDSSFRDTVQDLIFFANEEDARAEGYTPAE